MVSVAPCVQPVTGIKWRWGPAGRAMGAMGDWAVTRSWLELLSAPGCCSTSGVPALGGLVQVAAQGILVAFFLSLAALDTDELDAADQSWQRYLPGRGKCKRLRLLLLRGFERLWLAVPPSPQRLATSSLPCRAPSPILASLLLLTEVSPRALCKGGR